MKKILVKMWFAISVFLVASCTDDITTLNDNPKAYSSGSVGAETFFANATRELTDNLLDGFNFKIWAQQFAETTYFTTSNYTLTDVGSGFWTNLYMDVLNDYKEAKRLINENPTVYPGVDQNQLALVEIMEVYTYAILVNTYGNIPYSDALDASLASEALDPDNTTPAYDDAEAIYDDLLSRLDAALAMIDVDADNAGTLAFGESDLIYADDLAMWVKFGNSLKLRMGMILAEYNSGKAEAIVESVDFDNLISSNSENAELDYLATTPNTNPVWVWLVQSGREDYVASNTLMDMMQAPATDDPRIPLYYTVDNEGGYSAGTYGTSNAYVNFSKAGANITAETWPGILIDYVEVEFYLAEAAARGYTIDGVSAAEHYENAVTASIVYWGGSEADAATYLADPDVAFATAIGATNIQKIARQRYIGLFNRGFLAWVEYRRLNYPELNVPASTPGGPFPDRYTYPVSEQTSNYENYTAAAAAMGTDELTTLVFWDVSSSGINDAIN